MNLKLKPKWMIHSLTVSWNQCGNCLIWKVKHLKQLHVSAIFMFFKGWYPFRSYYFLFYFLFFILYPQIGNNNNVSSSWMAFLNCHVLQSFIHLSFYLYETKNSLGSWKIIPCICCTYKPEWSAVLIIGAYSRCGIRLHNYTVEGA